MLTEAANRLNVKLISLDADRAPAKQINALQDHVNGSFRDPSAIRELARRCDVLTIEIEHVDTRVLEELANEGVEVQPSWHTIRLIQDKYVQKEHLNRHGIPTARSIPLTENTMSSLRECMLELGGPFMLKSRTEAYDGRGNFPVKQDSSFVAALDALKDRPLYAEKWADFSMELAVMVVKTSEEATEDWQESTMSFPVVETIHEDSICKLVFAPARAITSEVSARAQKLARQTVATFKGKGVFGVEMFLLKDGKYELVGPARFVGWLTV